MLRIGLLTSGGDCQALNATMRGIVKTLMTNSEEPIEIYGFEDGVDFQSQRNSLSGSRVSAASATRE